MEHRDVTLDVGLEIHSAGRCEHWRLPGLPLEGTTFFQASERMFAKPFMTNAPADIDERNGTFNR